MAILDEKPAVIEEGKKDLWSNRKTGMLCNTCIFFVLKSAVAPTTKPVGRCRRHAPTMGGFPVVYPMDWCGDHKLDERKI